MPDNWVLFYFCLLVNVLLLATSPVKDKSSICPAYKPLSKVSLNVHPEDNGNKMATRNVLDWTVIGNFKINSHILPILFCSILFYFVYIRVIIKCVQTTFCKFPTSFSCHSLLEKSIFLFACIFFIYSSQKTPRSLYLFTSFQRCTGASEMNFGNLVISQKMNMLC